VWCGLGKLCFNIGNFVTDALTSDLFYLLLLLKIMIKISVTAAMLYKGVMDGDYPKHAENHHHSIDAATRHSEASLQQQGADNEARLPLLFAKESPRILMGLTCDDYTPTVSLLKYTPQAPFLSTLAEALLRQLQHAETAAARFKICHKRPFCLSVLQQLPHAETAAACRSSCRMSKRLQRVEAAAAR
jgi:hypothetical protein